MSYPDNATASLAQFLFRESSGAMYIIPRRAFHNGAEYGDTVTLVQDLSGNGHDLTGTAVFDRRSFFGGNRPLDNVRDAQFIRDVNMSAPVSGMGTTIRAVPGGTVMFDEGALDGTITGEFSVLILIDRTLSEREKHVVTELARLWGGANWTPGALFAGGQDGVWLDPSDHSTLWIDEARTQNATQPGDVVWWIDDKSGNENHFSVDASANRSRLVRWPASAVTEGRVRNRLVNTEDLSLWSSSGATITKNYPDIAAPDGSFTATRIQLAGLGWVKAAGLHANTSRQIWARSVTGTISTSLLTNRHNPGAMVTLTEDWQEYTRENTSPESAERGEIYAVDNRATPGGADILVWHPQAEDGPDITPYQRVGAGHWDVTEEGQPDCWGILANGVNTRYISERGVPEYEDGKLRMLVGQTKLRPVNIGNGVVLTNQLTGNTDNSYSVFAHLTGNRSYQVRYRSSSDTLVHSLDNRSLHTGILDVAASSGEGSVSLRINNDAPLAAAGQPGSIGDMPVGLLSYREGSSYYEGIVWSAILTAYEPDPQLWNRVARDWLNSANMPGVLDDD